jgi:hypothetical protein
LDSSSRFHLPANTAELGESSVRSRAWVGLLRFNSNPFSRSSWMREPPVIPGVFVCGASWAKSLFRGRAILATTLGFSASAASAGQNTAKDFWDAE